MRRTAAIVAKLVVPARQSRKLAVDTPPLSAPSGDLSSSETICSGLSYGSGRSSTPSTMLKIAAFAPTPSASVRTAASANVGCFRSVRVA
jgi:hypothetical protein